MSYSTTINKDHSDVLSVYIKRPIALTFGNYIYNRLGIPIGEIL